MIFEKGQTYSRNQIAWDLHLLFEFVDFFASIRLIAYGLDMFKNKALNQESIDNFLDAISKSDIDAVSLMLFYAHDKGLLVNSTNHGVSALSMAAGLGDKQVCRLLLASGARDFDKAYNIAIEKGHTEIAGVMIQKSFKHAGEKI